MTHHHNPPDPNCFGCKVAGVGFQGLQSRQGADPVERRPVIADEGTRAGKSVGKQEIHWDGRQDSTVFAPQLTLTTKSRES